jgi:two-component system, chemotaxis family, CheB/CheR fusion protein
LQSMQSTAKSYIVAIGGSAGALTPLKDFFDSISDNHTTYIIIQHLHPDIKSLTRDILMLHSKLEIIEADNGTYIDENKVYVLPSSSYMIIKNGRLYLSARDNFPLFPNLAIDIFLKSLAEEKGDESIAIILSGMGSDGTEGAKSIKENGGMVIAQTLESCEYTSMPESAIKTGCVDYELTPEEMPRAILKHITKID